MFPPAVITGASLMATNVMVEVAAAEFKSPSLTSHEMVRLVVGLSTFEENVTDPSAAK